MLRPPGAETTKPDDAETDHRTTITEAAENVCATLRGVDYAEGHFRVLLARRLRQKYDVYEEVVIPFVEQVIPFGFGKADIVLMVPHGAILLELKIVRKDCQRQLDRYLKHWSYSPVVGGATVHFVDDAVTLAFTDL